MCKQASCIQGVVTPIGAIVTAATGVKKRSRGQGLFLMSVKRSRTIFKLGKAVKIQFRMVTFLWPLTSGTVNNEVASVQRLTLDPSRLLNYGEQPASRKSRLTE